LWAAALKRFAERPVLGWGARSWEVDLGGYLPGYHPYGIGVPTGGAFHNAYLNLLAEKGLVGFVSGVGMLVFLFTCRVKLYLGRALLDRSERGFGIAAVFWTTILALHGLGEVGGLLGYANALVDFLCYWGASLIVALAAGVERSRCVRACSTHAGTSHLNGNVKNGPFLSILQGK